MSLEIRQLPQDQLKDFIKFPWKVYGNDPNWVPPLIIDRQDFLNPKKNPFFDHAKVAFYMAYKNGEPAGRIAATVNDRHNEFHQDKIGFFGMFECIHDQAVADALLDKAKEFIKSHGMDTLRGPMNLSTNDECGLLVDGLNQAPQVMMTYNPPYYIDLFEKFGLTKSKDLLAYRIDTPSEAPERIKRSVDLILKRNQFTVRKVNMKKFAEEVKTVKEIYNDAWELNWGFVPMTDAEFDRLGKEMKLILDPDFLFIAEHNGEPVAFSLTIPNANEALIKIRNGKLFPFGLVKLLWNMRKGRIRSVRVITLGIKKAHRSSGIDIVFYYKCFEEAIKKNIPWAEMSWILEDNLVMNRALERLGAVVYKRYRIYDKSLG